MNGLPRRGFLFPLAGTGAGMPLIVEHACASLEHLAPTSIDNPLVGCPYRGWEQHPKQPNRPARSQSKDALYVQNRLVKIDRPRERTVTIRLTPRCDSAAADVVVHLFSEQE